MSIIRNYSINTVRVEPFETLNRDLLLGLEQFIDAADTRKTHRFNGRYENIYIGRDKIPALGTLVEHIIQHAASILKRPETSLKAGLWFNVMRPGDSTTLHRHDDDDELLSAVYYLKVPENSGELILAKGPVTTRVTPEEGMLVFFPPSMPHEVSINLSQAERISLGINIGPLHAKE